MVKAKAKTKASTDAPDGTKAYRHTRTGAIRFSSSILGYPYEAVETKVAKADESKAEGDQ